MNSDFKEYFITRWNNYFPGAPLPICFYYTDAVSDEDEENSGEHYCLIGSLNRVRSGRTLIYHAKTNGCPGAKRFSGYSQKLRADFPYFLSCGIPGLFNGERYKKSPALVKAFFRNIPPFRAPGKYLVFKRWDMLAAEDEPLAVIFFATPNILAGLNALANYDIAEPDGVITPWGSGCASIVYYPYMETQSERSRCVLGMFDVSARSEVPKDLLTLTVPMRRFTVMVNNMDKSFLITESWEKVKKRLQ